ncbi:MAG: ASKHA domain-containing protein [bacterium]
MCARDLLVENKSHMCRVILEPSGMSLEVPRGTTILEAASGAGFRIRAECGGKGLCGKCIVKVHPPEGASPPEIAESEFITQKELEAGIRLACQCRIEGFLSVEVPPESQETEEALGKIALRGRYRVDPTVKRLFLAGSGASLGDERQPSDLVEKLLERLEELGILPEPRLELGALRELSMSPSLQGDLTVICHKDRGITGIREGIKQPSLGVALDIGTTTLAAYLCDLTSGEILASAGVANPQRRFGQDVISRIGFASQGRGSLLELHREVIQGLNGLIHKCLARARAAAQQVDEVVAVGNTCMVELFSGLNPRALGAAPYLPVTRSFPDLRASELGLEISPGANVHILPVISGFVGADTVSAILADGLHNRHEITLLVDIGTNGEIVLGGRCGLWATSCATGPALEGAHISCGMRAIRGAIHRVWEHGGRLHWETLGGPEARPRGLCGSGIIDAIATLRSMGVILPSGRLKEEAPGVILDEKGIGRAFPLVGKQDTATAKDIQITLGDIRQIQLAKAALCVGIMFLMRRAGVERVDRLVLTGAFGARFDWRSAVAIGMIPQEAISGEVETMENAAGLGAVMALLDQGQRREAASLARSVKVLELAQEPDFGVEYPMAMGFPAARWEESPDLTPERDILVP